jgi:hypothetical protein
VEIYFGETLATKEGANNDNSVKKSRFYRMKSWLSYMKSTAFTAR